MIRKGRAKKIREPRRCDYDDVLVPVSVKIPQGLLREVDDLVAENNPEPYYNRNHYIICALIRQNKVVRDGV